MNENIEKAMYASGLTAQGCWDSMDRYDQIAVLKFGVLLIQECIRMIETEASQYAEPVWAIELVNDMQERFGVEL